VTELPPLTTTDRTRVKRQPDRSRDDRAMAYAILDEGRVAHVGFAPDGQPFVIPMAYGRDGDRLLLHGAKASRLIRTTGGGVPVCVTVTLLDGLVLARSTFHHSMNYRSVVLLGQATRVEGDEAKTRALEAFTDKLVPGRWPEVRWPSRKELKATHVLSLPIDEASAKVRTGGPVDDEPDYALEVWAGVVPLSLTASDPIPDPDGRPDAVVPEHVRTYTQRHGPVQAQAG
jgi:nitroimidazol reductase NimA-like FMN-containing flavoprotein (pyridoxamine 5'-phosphate oxidase superfamily)